VGTQLKNEVSIMSIFGRIILRPVLNFMWDAVRRIGALVRWPFLHRKLRIEEIYLQNWSIIVGIVFLSFAMIITMLLIE
jgi:hypothetical protein